MKLKENEKTYAEKRSKMGLHNEKTERGDIEEATLLREVRKIID